MNSAIGIIKINKKKLMKKVFLVSIISLLLLTVSVVMLIAEPDRPTDLPPPPATPAVSQDQTLWDKEPQERQHASVKPGATATPHPGEVILDPAPVNLGASLPPTPAAYEPGDTLTSYRDATFGFSFDYPTNWILDAPTEKIDQPLVPYEVFLTNFNPEMQIKNNPPDGSFVSIHIVVYSKPSGDESMERWLRFSYHPDTQFTALEPMTGQKVTMQRWIATGPTLPYELVIVTLNNGANVYSISYGPAKTKYSETVEKVISSFVAP
jgi:hypothetical protein